MITVKTILSWLNEIAPFETAENFDNVGLIIGNQESEVRNVIFCLDITQQVVQEAVELGDAAIISHHPFIFGGIKRLDYNQRQTQCLTTILENKIQVIAAHTNWDQADGGVSDALCECLGLSQCVSLDAYVRMGEFKESMTVEKFEAHVESALQIRPRMFGFTGKPIKKVALAGGAYGEGIYLAQDKGADAYVVGEIQHHHLMEMRTLGVVDAGHYATEWPGVKAMHVRFEQEVFEKQWEVKSILTRNVPFSGALII